MIALKDVLEQATPESVGLGVVLPAALTAGARAVGTKLPARYRGLIGAVALAGGVCAGYFALGLGPVSKWIAGNHWLPHLTLLAIPAGWAASRSRPFRFAILVLTITAFAT